MGIIFLLLLRRRRERARRLAHESFGNLGPASGIWGRRGGHTSTPSGEAFLGGYFNRAENRQSKHFFSRMFAFAAPARNLATNLREKGQSNKNAPQWEIVDEMHEKPAGRGEGGFLPPLERLPSISPIGEMMNVPAVPLVASDPFTDSAVAKPADRPFAAYAQAARPSTPLEEDPFWDPNDLLPPALRLSKLRKGASSAQSSPRAVQKDMPVVDVEEPPNSALYGAGIEPLPRDPFADSGIIDGNASQTTFGRPGTGGSQESAGSGTKSITTSLKNTSSTAVQQQSFQLRAPSPLPEMKSVRASVPDIFDYRPESIEESNHRSWVTQPGWTSNARDSSFSSTAASVAEAVPDLPPHFQPYSGEIVRPDSMGVSSIRSSSNYSGMGVDDVSARKQEGVLATLREESGSPESAWTMRSTESEYLVYGSAV